MIYIKPLTHTRTWLCVTDGQVTPDYYLSHPSNAKITGFLPNVGQRFESQIWQKDKLELEEIWTWEYWKVVTNTDNRVRHLTNGAIDCL